MSYRLRVEAAILAGTPVLRALRWALASRRGTRSLLPTRYLATHTRSREAE